MDENKTVKTQKEKFLELMAELGVKTTKNEAGEGIIGFGVSDVNYVECEFIFDKDGKFKNLDCYN